jgi:hypothetical protein
MKCPLATLMRRSLAYLIAACVADLSRSDLSEAGIQVSLVAGGERRYNRRV